MSTTRALFGDSANDVTAMNKIARMNGLFCGEFVANHLPVLSAAFVVMARLTFSEAMIRVAAGERTLPERGSSNFSDLIIVVAENDVVARQVVRPKLRIRCHIFVFMMAQALWHSGFLRSGRKGRGNGGCEPVPAVRFFAQTPAAGCGQLVKLCPAIVFRFSPFRLEKTLPNEPKQSRIKRPLLHEQSLSGDLFNAGKHGVTVERAKRDRLQNQEIKCARQEFGFIAHGLFS